MSKLGLYDINTMKAKKRLVTKKIKAIKAQPLTEDQIQLFVKFYNKNGSFPGSKIPCTVTGKLTTCIGPWMMKKIKEFGGAENLLRNYKCRGALKAERQINKPVVTKKRKRKLKELKDENKEWIVPKIEFTPPRSMTDSEVARASRTECFRPDIFLTNGRHCDGCPIFEVCENRLKCLPKYFKTDARKSAKRKVK
jgi:hypothetical protein